MCFLIVVWLWMAVWTGLQQECFSIIVWLWMAVWTGLQQDVQGQLSHEEAPAHSWTTCSCLCGVWQGLCRELQAKETPAGPYRWKTFPGVCFIVQLSKQWNVILISISYASLSHYHVQLTTNQIALVLNVLFCFWQFLLQYMSSWHNFVIIWNAFLKAITTKLRHLRLIVPCESWLWICH